ncbi:MAG: thioredoxin family protein [Candidatus Eremiobacteraeota bacterium]|nr:thioredoxin family protein [Candidatus Eremiobacteraeota bacterium]
MASLAVTFSMISPRITAEIIEAQEFTDIASRYTVMGVPRTVINDNNDDALEGAVPADVLLQKILEA